MMYRQAKTPRHLDPPIGFIAKQTSILKARVFGQDTVAHRLGLLLLVSSLIVFNCAVIPMVLQHVWPQATHSKMYIPCEIGYVATMLARQCYVDDELLLRGKKTSKRKYIVGIVGMVAAPELCVLFVIHSIAKYFVWLVSWVMYGESKKS